MRCSRSLTKNIVVVLGVREWTALDVRVALRLHPCAAVRCTCYGHLVRAQILKGVLRPSSMFQTHTSLERMFSLPGFGEEYTNACRWFATASVVLAFSRVQPKINAVKNEIGGEMKLKCESMEAFRNGERSTREGKTIFISCLHEVVETCTDRSGLAKVYA